MSTVVALLSGGLTFAAALIVLTTQRRSLVRQRVTPYIGAPVATSEKLRQLPALRSAGLMNSLLVRTNLEQPFALLIDRAGMTIATESFAAVIAGSAAVAFLVVMIAANPAVALAGAVVGGAVPWIVLELKGRRRSRAFERQLPEILDTLAASLRAGHSFDQAIQSLAADMSEPAGRELRRIVAATQLGRSVDESLTDLGNRIKSDDLHFVLDAIVIQRQVGGSLAGLFELVAHTVRAREEFRRKVRALTSLPRASANVLTVLPFVAAVGLTVINRSYMSPLWHTSTGHVMIAIGLAMMLCGSVILRKVGSVKA